MTPEQEAQQAQTIAEGKMKHTKEEIRAMFEEQKALEGNWLVLLENGIYENSEHQLQWEGFYKCAKVLGVLK
jgi:hypothetical protein